MRGAEPQSQGNRGGHNQVRGLQCRDLQEGPGGSVRRLDPEIAVRQDPPAAAEGQAAGEDQEAIALIRASHTVRIPLVPLLPFPFSSGHLTCLIML